MPNTVFKPLLVKKLIADIEGVSVNTPISGSLTGLRTNTYCGTITDASLIKEIRKLVKDANKMVRITGGDCQYMLDFKGRLGSGSNVSEDDKKYYGKWRATRISVCDAERVDVYLYPNLRRVYGVTPYTTEDWG